MGAVCSHSGLSHGKMSGCEQGSADAARRAAWQQNPAASCKVKADQVLPSVEEKPNQANSSLSQLSLNNQENSLNSSDVYYDGGIRVVLGLACCLSPCSFGGKAQLLGARAASKTCSLGCSAPTPRQAGATPQPS